MTENVIAENIAAIKKDIPENVTLVGVTKHRSVDCLLYTSDAADE